MSHMRVIATAVLALGTGMAVMAQDAQARTILAFGQTDGGSPVTAVNNGAGSTTISGTDIPVTITTLNGSSSNVLAYLDFSVTSTNAAQTINGNVVQSFSGTVSFFSGPSGGTNYLTSSFVDFVFGAGSSLTLSASTPPSNAVEFTSDVIPKEWLGDPRALSLAFADVTPQVGICGGSLCGFTASVAGTASASKVAVPEPASLTLLGAGLLGLAFARRKRPQPAA